MFSRDQLETHQIKVYFIAIILAIAYGIKNPSLANALESMITPILGILIYAMFSQIPFLQVQQAFKNYRFLLALTTANFVLVPLFVWVIVHFVVHDPLLQVGIAMVLLTPCIDYVIVFTHLGRGDVKLMLISTPILFVLQMILLPIYLRLFLNPNAAHLISIVPFLKAFLCLIVLPLVCALLLQLYVDRSNKANTIAEISAWLPVPLMATTLFIVIASQIQIIVKHFFILSKIVPIYIAYLIAALLIGLIVKRLFHLKPKEARTLTFSVGTRNSLVVLPFALALPSPANNLVAVVIVTQTIVELVGEIFYLQIIPKLMTESG